MAPNAHHVSAHPEAVRVQRGARTGQMIVVSIDSTRLGPALGGCRIRSYPTWQDGLADALRLSAAMTEKAALAGLAHGGGKTVVALDAGSAAEFTGPRRGELLADVADLVESFDGGYLTGPDVGSAPQDMIEIGRGTSRALCRPESAGGSGDSSGPTATGVIASIDAVREHVLGGRPLESLSFSLLGLGHVGALVGEHLAAAGARLVVTDVDTSRRALAERWGATWNEPDEALTADVDVVVPCAVGGFLTPETVPALRCRAIVGAANNQLDADSTADLLHARGICWAPDTVVSAGGIVSAVSREVHGASPDEADLLVRDIGRRLGEVLAAAASRDVPPLHEARRRVRELLDVSA
ncbi:Glu/Leu/Phe/Val dehydrogenase dimerization domain-containing protein [Umezawaea beigongshangensis]|uniref:Glu/Leu/Phe/Val dehydrogenase dimerization domain-containing protein n=1 Tax=Umezawaea beigongshangensis TaxID=2780383 RepID=UPI001E52A6EE|nr:Glu/Leu/Phe/Val dehydrogenase dimerization domain-containing protein [Umezawaea beigongshangensis]